MVIRIKLSYKDEATEHQNYMQNWHMTGIKSQSVLALASPVDLVGPLLASITMLAYGHG